MIIDRIEPIALRVPIPRDAYTERPAGALDAMHLVLCRVTTRSGVTGHGEALCYMPEPQRALVALIEDFLAPALRGQNVSERVALNATFRRKTAAFGRAGLLVNALAAVDIALWDIAGKEAGRPLATMIGEVRRSEVPVMASLDRHADARLLQARVEHALRQGVEAVKVHETDLGVIEAARRIAGDVAFVADLNNGWTAPELETRAARLRDLSLLWLEDPVWPPESLLTAGALDGLRIGVGGDLGSAEQLGLYVAAPAVAVAQPDVCMLGGLSETIGAARRAESVGRSVAPHTPFVGPAALAALHLLAVLEEETHFAMVDVPEIVDPFGIGITRWRRSIEMPQGAGLGADPDPTFLARFAAAR